MSNFLMMMVILVPLAIGSEPPSPASTDTDGEKRGDASTEKQAESATGVPTSQPGDREQVDKLVAQLGVREFKQREAAQRELTEMGDRALVHLVPHVTSEDPEIAARVATLVGTPRDPAIRVALAMRLMETADPDWLERGVHMLFKTPGEVYAIFMERTRDARGMRRALYAPVREQFESWKRMDDMIQRTSANVREKDAEKADQLLKFHEESSMYCAEAAYWGALEAIEDFRQHPLQDGPDLPTPRKTSPQQGAESPNPDRDGQ